MTKKQAFGPYRILEVNFERGRIKVELEGDFPVGKSNEFTMDHVRRHWEQRPWRYDTVGLDERLDPAANMDETEYEVDAVASRRFLRGKYKYSVSFKRWDQVSELQPRDAPNFEGCQRLLDEFDQRHPLGSLPYDKPEDMRLYKETTTEARARRSSRRRARSRNG